MENSIWDLIQDVTNIIRRCTELMRFYPDDGPPEAKAFNDTVHKIFAVERDHLEALKYLCDHTVKDKPATDMTLFAKETLADYREQNKLIK